MAEKSQADPVVVQEEQLKTGLTQPWWRRKKILLLIAAAIAIVIIAVGVGVGVSVQRKNASSDSDSDEQTTLVSPTSGSRVLWQPKVGDSWQIILRKSLKLSSKATSVTPDVAVYDLDMYDNSAETFKTLHRLGKKVICYFSAGSFENWRDDAKDFKESDKGSPLDGWEGEWWVDTRSENVRNIMKKRIQLASEKGCDAIDPDNIDAYDNDNGLGLTQEDAIDYVKFLSKEARKYSMSTGLKNSADIIPDVLDVTSFCVNEQCAEYGECETYSPFIQQNKPVFHIEYPSSAPSISPDQQEICCDKNKVNAAGSEGFSTIMKNMDLDGFAQYCSGKIANTAISA